MYLIVLKLLFVAFLTYPGINCDSASESPETAGLDCDGSGWVKFKEDKCYKVIKQFAVRKDAETLCAQEWLPSETYKPTLVTIQSADEQEFLDKFIFETAEVGLNVWLGAKRDAQNASQFLWDDGSVVEYGNWVVGSPTGETKRQCVDLQAPFTRKLMDSQDSTDQVAGKWRDVTCISANYVVCQKLQRWSFEKLQRIVVASQRQLEESKQQLKDTNEKLEKTSENLEETKGQLDETNKKLTETNEKLEVKTNPVPIGFTYVQLPKDKSPKDIWPSMSWTNVSSDYAGVFFRVEGGGAAAFGTKQSDNAPRLTGVKFQPVNAGKGEIETKLGDWSDWCFTASQGNGNAVANSYQMSSGEVRPVNMAIRVWKRTG